MKPRDLQRDRSGRLDRRMRIHEYIRDLRFRAYGILTKKAVIGDLKSIAPSDNVIEIMNNTLGHRLWLRIDRIKMSVLKVMEIPTPDA